MKAYLELVSEEEDAIKFWKFPFKRCCGMLCIAVFLIFTRSGLLSVKQKKKGFILLIVHAKAMYKIKY